MNNNEDLSTREVQFLPNSTIIFMYLYNMKIKLLCFFCKKEFEIPLKEYNRKIKNGKDKFFCSMTCSAKFNNYMKYKVIYPKKKICIRCNKEFEVYHNNRNKKYCSTVCSKSRKLSNITKEKIRKKNSIIIKNKWLNDKEYSNKILSFANKSNFFTSKNEVFIRNYFILNFPNDEWTFGGRLKYKNEFISRDLYSKKMKICFEYDGIWHFKNIKNQLEKKKKKDILLEKWCIENNWRLIRISETWFIEHNKPINDIVEIIYKSKEPIIKIGKEYEM